MSAPRHSGSDILAMVSRAARRREHDQHETLTGSEIAWLRMRRNEENSGRRARQIVAEAGTKRGNEPDL